MKTLNLPTSGNIYVDTQAIVYTVEKHPVYAPVLRPLWTAARGTNRVITSDITLLETLVLPIRNADTGLQTRFETFLLHSDTRLLPITHDILREAARLRATVSGMKAPDAIHAATALLTGCALFITNDSGFRHVPNLPVVMLDDVLATP